MIIGVCGLIGSGKGTVADLLVDSHRFHKLAFADSLKDGVAAMFDWPRSMLEGDTSASREWREQADTFWSQEIGHTITPRFVLQKVGTECMRHGLFDGIWVSRTKQKIQRQSYLDFVIPDVRFPNEIEMIHSQGGIVVEVKRGPQPQWAQEFRTLGAEPKDVHPSEWMWMKERIDHVIENNGSLLDLKNQVSNLLDAISHQSSE
jgi:hypothetical protein